MDTSYFKTKYGLMYYEFYSEDKNDSEVTIVLLHGWGMTGETFRSIIERLKGKYKLLCLDMLGFGRSDEPLESIKLEDYTSVLKKLIEYLKLKKIIIIGHSFGGRVAIMYRSLYECEKVFLVNTPAFKNKSIKYYFNLFKYKIKKFMLYVINKNKYYDFVKNSGSLDYKMCSYIMKGTFKNIVRRDLKDELKKIKEGVIIIGSVHDTQVKYKDNIKMYKLIENSEMYAFYNSNHFSYLEEEEKFIKIINKYLENKI